ncbi:MAG TPA: ribosome biogenesis GTPase Der [Edaphocola sp.]|nr:ribosome biogenesis GTPase Der [Edaphocola sp.]
MQGFTVAIVGRPNVGKSTLFNRLVEQRQAIVDDFSGVTRDRQYGICDWNGKSFNVIDTGGFVSDSEDVFEREIRTQVHIAIEEAHVILFVVDTSEGITLLDEDMAKVLSRSSKPVILVVNKVDNPKRQLAATEFYSFGFEHIVMIASASGQGTGDMLDMVTGFIPTDYVNNEDVIWVEEENEYGELIKVPYPKNPIPKIAIIGQPNAGKSTLLNALVGKERSIVSDIPGTTRDAIHTQYNMFQKEFILIDTAGIRKKKSVNEDLEFYSVIRAIKAMDEADVCMMLLDAEVGITAQDINIYSLATRKGKGIVVLINKWDKIEGKTTNTAKEYEKKLKERLLPFCDVPVMFISAQEKQRIFQAMEKALEVYETRKQKIATSVLNEVMLKETEYYKPPMARGLNVRIKFVMQIPTIVPSFAFYSNRPEDIKKPYQNFLENKLRQHFGFHGVPINIFFRKK